MISGFVVSREFREILGAPGCGEKTEGVKSVRFCTKLLVGMVPMISRFVASFVRFWVSLGGSGRIGGVQRYRFCIKLTASQQGGVLAPFSMPLGVTAQGMAAPCHELWGSWAGAISLVAGSLSLSY